MRFTARLNRKARPVAPVNLVDMSSSLLVRLAPHSLQLKHLAPVPMCVRNGLPIFKGTRKLNVSNERSCSQQSETYTYEGSKDHKEVHYKEAIE